MAVVPVIRCRNMAVSLRFYREVLGFHCVEFCGEADPTFNVFMTDGDLLVLSSHSGDGEFGQAIMVTTTSVDVVARRVRARGLKTPGNPDAPQEVHEGPVDQSWGTREFYVDDPDGNTIRFVEGFGIGHGGGLS